MKRRIPSLNWLRVFEAAAKDQNFARAALSLNMSTSAVSQQIKSLEGYLGEELFKRGPRHVELTDVGHAFLPAIRQSLSTIEESANSLFGAEKDNTLTLQATLIFATAWLAPRLPDFALHHPNVQLHLNGSYYDDDYQRPGSELRILFGPVHRSWGQCDRLFSETIYPVTKSNIAASIRTVDALLDHRLIQVTTHSINWNQILRSLGVDDVPSRQLCFADTTEIALSMAASGYGIALARKPTTDDIIKKLSLKPCKVCRGLASNEAYYLMYQNAENLSGAAKSFRNWILKQSPVV